MPASKDASTRRDYAARKINDFGTARRNRNKLNNSHVLSRRSDVPGQVSKEWVHLDTIARDARRDACSALKKSMRDDDNDPTCLGLRQILRTEHKLDDTYIASLMEDLENGYKK